MAAERRDYSHVEITVAPIPVPVKSGGWWKRSWTLAVPGQEDLSAFNLPIPSTEMSAAVICLVPVGASKFLLQVLTLTEILDGDTQTYLAVIAASLKKQFGVNVAVDGLRDHPWFAMVKI